MTLTLPGGAFSFRALARVGVGLALLLLLASPIAAAQSPKFTVDPSGGAAANEPKDRPFQIDCIDIFPANVCRFLEDPFSVIFGAIAYALSIPFLLLASGIRTVFGYVANGIANVWGWFSAAAKKTTDMLVSIIPDGSAIGAAFTSFNDDLLVESARLGPLAPLGILIVYLSLAALVILVFSYGVKAVRFLNSRDLRDLR